MYPPHHYGGYELSCQDVVARFRQRGHEVLVLTSDTRIAGEASDGAETGVRRDLGIYMRGHHLDSPPLHRRLQIERRNEGVLARALAEFRPDVASIWNHAALSLGMLETLNMHGVPMVLVVCNEWLVHGPQWDAWMRLFLGRPRLAWSVRRATGVRTALPDLSSASVCYLSKWIRGKSVEHSPFKVPVSTVVYSGIEREHFPAPTAYTTDWRWRLLYVGRLDPSKGAHVAIDALGHLPAATLEIVGRGDDDYANELRARADRLGVAGRVAFRYAPRGELHRHYAQADVFLFPVLWDEPFGLVPLEAMASATPVIATGTGGSSEYLFDGVNCLLVPKDDGGALAAAVERLAANPDLRARLIARGLQTAAVLDVDRLADVLEAWHLAAAARFADGRPSDRPSPAALLIAAGAMEPGDAE